MYRYGAHGGEEPPISGSRGSGAVFFSRCTLRCLYCQNYPWSQDGRGDAYTPEDLAGILNRLRAEGCHNWNLVSPTPWLPMIGAALRLAGAAGQRLPVVYNTSGYERVETLRGLDGMADVYLTDLRYATEASARRGSGAADYVNASRAALREMWRQKGPLELGADGLARRGVICRILILPGLAREACQSLEWLAGAVGTRVAVSVMAQYTPAYRAAGLAEWGRPITRAEYDAVCRAAERLGFGEGWIQDFGGAGDTALAGYRMAPRGKELDNGAGGARS